VLESSSLGLARAGCSGHWRRTADRAGVSGTRGSLRVSRRPRARDRARLRDADADAASGENGGLYLASAA